MTMQRLSLVSVALVALSAAGPAGAADLPVKAAPPVAAAAAFNWSRCYVGAHAGYGWGHNSNGFGNAVASGPTEEPLFFPAEFGPFDHNTRGGVIGGQVGCNWQFAPNWLVGVEGEFKWSSIKGGFTAPEDATDPGRFSRFESWNRWDGDIALRFGHIIGPSLLYGKVGVSFGNFLYTETHDDFPTTHACPGGFECSVSISANRTGLLLGAGWELALPAIPPVNHWTVKLEYNYINYGTINIAYPSAAAAIQSFPVSDIKHIVKVGVNFYFP